MARKMVWLKRIEGWGCSDCAWIFLSSGPPLGYTIDEMKLNFIGHRDKEFMSHVCAGYSNKAVLQKLNYSK